MLGTLDRMKEQSRSQLQTWREGRRLRAWALQREGWSQRQIARALSETQRSEVVRLLEQGAEAFGYTGAVWTTTRVAEVIARELGISYHPAHVSRLLRRLDWSVQKPIQRAGLRDEAVIAAWQTDRWSALNKAAAEGRTVIWVDEAGFFCLPGVVRTYAPRGQTPVLRVPLSRDHLSVIDGITAEGRLFHLVQTAACRSGRVVRFLRHLLRQIPGKLLVIWDGAPIHRSQVIKDFLASGAAARLLLERLPGYAPDLNPQEGIWQCLKHVELRNRCCRSLVHLRTEFWLATGRLRHKREVIRGCIRHCYPAL